MRVGETTMKNRHNNCSRICGGPGRSMQILATRHEILTLSPWGKRKRNQSPSCRHGEQFPPKFGFPWRNFCLRCIFKLSAWIFNFWVCSVLTYFSSDTWLSQCQLFFISAQALNIIEWEAIAPVDYKTGI